MDGERRDAGGALAGEWVSGLDRVGLNNIKDWRFGDRLQIGKTYGLAAPRAVWTFELISSAAIS